MMSPFSEICHQHLYEKLAGRHLLIFLFEMIFWIDMCCEVQFYMFYELHHSKDLQSFSQEGPLGSTVLNTSPTTCSVFFFLTKRIVSDVNTTVEPEWNI